MVILPVLYFGVYLLARYVNGWARHREYMMEVDAKFDQFFGPNVGTRNRI